MIAADITFHQNEISSPETLACRIAVLTPSTKKAHQFPLVGFCYFYLTERLTFAFACGCPRSSAAWLASLIAWKSAWLSSRNGSSVLFFAASSAAVMARICGMASSSREAATDAFAAPDTSAKRCKASSSSAETDSIMRLFAIINPKTVSNAYSITQAFFVRNNGSAGARASRERVRLWDAKQPPPVRRRCGVHLDNMRT